MPATPYDEALFAETGTAGMRFEKMTSGRYMVATRALGVSLASSPPCPTVPLPSPSPSLVFRLWD